MAGLTDIELVSIIKAYRREALGNDDGDLSNERAKAFDHYHGRPYGDEQQDRSQVVTKELAETIDWIMPQLMRIFTQSGNITEFSPVGGEDEEQAGQETDYVNHVIMKDNNGFMLLHDWFKDALILKNGYVKHYWDESEKISEREYDGLTEDQLVALFADLGMDGAEIEVLEQEEKYNSVTVNGMAMQNIAYEIKLAIKKKTNRVRIVPIPVEEIRVSKDCTGDIQSAYFVEHVTIKTRSELLEMGMDENFVDSLPAFNEDEHDDIVYARDSVADESEDELGMSWDRSMDEVEYCEAYILADYDGDGVAERRKVVTCGNRIPPGDEWNEMIDCVPITDIVPKRIPHRHIGESLDDDLADLQRIKTVLTRQLLDNIYITNNQQFIVNNRVHLPDFLKSLPGGVKRVLDDDPVGGAVEPVVTTPILHQILPAIDYIDTVKQNRSGINDSNSGLDPDVLKETTKGAYLAAMSKANQKIEMIARMFAETGVKNLILRVHELLIKHQDIPRIIRLRGKYVPVNPSEWRERTDLTVRVGIGTGTEEEKQQRLMALAAQQERLMGFGLVGPSHAYRMFTDFSRALGFDLPEKYALDPASPEYQQMQTQQAQQQQPNPLAEVEQVKGQFKLESDRMQIEFKSQIELMKEQQKMQITQIQESHKHEMDMMKMQAEAINKEADRRSKEAIETAKLEVQAMLEGWKTDLGKPGIGAELQDV